MRKFFDKNWKKFQYATFVVNAIMWTLNDVLPLVIVTGIAATIIITIDIYRWLHS